MTNFGKIQDFIMGVFVAFSIVISIMARDVKTRFSGSLFGYVLVLATPVAWIAVTILSFEIVGRIVPIFTDPVSFVLAGILPYLLFRYTVTATVRAVSGFESFLVLSGVRKMHVILAFSLMELMNAVVIYCLVSFLNWMIFSCWEVFSFHRLIYGVFLAWISGLSLGCLVCSISRVFPVLPRMLPVILRPTFIISAVFFSANELPESVIDYLSWNPLLHANEVVREGMFDGYQSFRVDYVYPLALSMCFFMLSLLIDRYLDERTSIV